MTQPTIERIWTNTGLAGVAAGVGGIVIAVLLSPWFSWTENALSHLGDPTHASAPFFNGGVILAGFLGVAFGLRVLLATEPLIQRSGVAFVTLALANMGLVGVFDVTHDLHGPVAVAFFLGITYGWFVQGSGLVLTGNRRRGLGVIWLGIGHVSAWLIWAAVGPDGIALPETAGALLLAVWIWEATRSLGRTAGGG